MLLTVQASNLKLLKCILTLVEMDTDEGGQFIIVDEAEVRDCIEGLHKVHIA